MVAEVMNSSMNPLESISGSTANIPGVSSLNPVQVASLYVGDLNPEVTEAILYEAFNTAGPVASIRVCRDSVSRRSLGYAYINFHNVDDAQRALETLNFTPIRGRPCRVMWSLRDPMIRRSGNGNLYVKNLDKSIDNKSLHDTFAMFGNILSCKIATDDKGRSRGFGFVHFEKSEDAGRAIEKLDGSSLNGKMLGVCYFKKSSERDVDVNKYFTNVYVKHFPESWTDADLKSAFSEIGEVTSAVVQEDSRNRKFGFVNFKEADDARRAIVEFFGKDMRTPEQIEEANRQKAEREEKRKAGEEVEDSEDDTPLREGFVRSYQLYVCRAQPKLERQQVIKAKISGSQSEKLGEGQLFVKNLPEEYNEDNLRELFSPFGKISSVRVMRQDKQISRCFGFVNFVDQASAHKAIAQLHNHMVMGKPLFVAFHEQKNERLDKMQRRHFNANIAAPTYSTGNMMNYPYSGAFGNNVNPQMMPVRGGYPAPSLYMGNQNQMRGPSNMGRMMHQSPNASMMAPYGGMQPNMGRMQYPMGPNMMMPRNQFGGMMPMQQQQFNRNRMMQMPNRNQMQYGMRNMGGYGQQQVQPQATPTSQQIGYEQGAPLVPAQLAGATPAEQKRILGEKLFPIVQSHTPEYAGKITGMMLEMDNSELLMLLDNDMMLQAKIDEAMLVLGRATSN